jgi:hypothetical protein
MTEDALAAKLHATTDARVWAEEFMKIVRAKWDGATLPIDEGLMIGWFANAMETVEVLRHGSDVRRYRDALEQIWAMMGPQNSEHVESCISCEGCLFEWEETLQVVRNVLDGKEVHDHWGEPVRLQPRSMPHAD